MIEFERGGWCADGSYLHVELLTDVARHLINSLAKSDEVREAVKPVLDAEEVLTDALVDLALFADVLAKFTAKISEASAHLIAELLDGGDALVHASSVAPEG